MELATVIRDIRMWYHLVHVMRDGDDASIVTWMIVGLHRSSVNLRGLCRPRRVDSGSLVGKSEDMAQRWVINHKRWSEGVGLLVYNTRSLQPLVG